MFSQSFFLGGYAADHVSQPDLFTSAVALDAGAFALVICGIGTL